MYPDGGSGDIKDTMPSPEDKRFVSYYPVLRQYGTKSIEKQRVTACRRKNTDIEQMILYPGVGI